MPSMASTDGTAALHRIVVSSVGVEFTARGRQYGCVVRCTVKATAQSIMEMAEASLQWRIDGMTPDLANLTWAIGHYSVAERRFELATMSEMVSYDTGEVDVDFQMWAVDRSPRNPNVTLIEKKALKPPRQKKVVERTVSNLKRFHIDLDEI